jgi:phosphoglycolate phosphatase
MRGIVFDLDGTLIDSAPDIAAAVNAVLAGEGAAPLTPAEVRSFIGNGARTLVARAMAARGLPPDDLPRLHAAFLRLYDRAHDRTTLYPGVIDALSALRDAGFVLGICTNKPSGPARAVLDRFGLAPFFGALIGGDSLDRMKPDPAPLLAAFGALGTAPHLFVGDSEVDHAAAVAAGVPFALFTEGYRRQPAGAFAGAIPFADYARLPALAAGI